MATERRSIHSLWALTSVQIGVLLVVTLVIYLPALWRNGFVYEDSHALSFMAVIRQYHLFSLALHLTAGLLVYRLAELSGIRNAWVVAAVVLWHPIQVETVAYAASWRHLAVACEVLAACLVAVQPTRWWRIVLILGWAYVAHETYAVGILCLPLALIVGFPRMRHRFWAPRIWVRVASVVVPVGLWLVWRLLPVVLREDGNHEGVSRLVWAGTQARAFLTHSWHFLFPLGDQWAVYHEAMARPVGGLWLAIGLLGYLGVVWRLRRSQAVTWLLWVGVCLAPRFLVREVAEPLSEHHLYLAVIGVGMLLAMALDRLEAKK